MGNNQTVLVTGGAGYIGSHVALYYIKQGYQVIILDNYTQGQTQLPFLSILFNGDYGDPLLLNKIFTDYKISAVIHCGAVATASASEHDPLSYYDNNVSKTVTLLQQMVKHRVLRFIFSSSCAVYGAPQSIPLTETHPCNPISPYGKTKLMIEQILYDCQKSYGMEYVILRYFNAFGIEPGSGLQEVHVPETHVVPLLFYSAQSDIPFYIFGTDYATPDGTCVRDYVHIHDIASAHYKALLHLKKKLPSDIFNLGTGRGWSVKEVINAVEVVLQKKVIVIPSERRTGDLGILVASCAKASHILEWAPVYTDLILGITTLLC